MEPATGDDCAAAPAAAAWLIAIALLAACAARVPVVIVETGTMISVGRIWGAGMNATPRSTEKPVLVRPELVTGFEAAFTDVPGFGAPNW